MRQRTGLDLQESVSPIRPEEHACLVEVWEAAVRATHHFLGEADISFLKPLLRDEFLYAVELVGMRDALGRIIGFLGVADRKIEMLFVDPMWHGRGVGRQLVEYALEHFEAEKVDVNEQNEQAVGFYLRLGFEVRGRSEQDSMGKPFPLLHLLRRGVADEAARPAI